MVVLTLDILVSKLQEILNKQASREDVDRWAYLMIQKAEQGLLLFEPKDSKELIWDTVMFLYGIDIQSEPSVYLTSDDEIVEREKMLLIHLNKHV
jgi:hypothetical protein